MLFNSYTFIFFFLPLCWLVYSLLRSMQLVRASLSWLILSSLVFYGWVNPSFVPLILVSVGINYLASVGLAIQSNYNARRTILIGAIAFDLLLLGYFKYAMFTVDSWNSIFGTGFNIDTIVLPAGISFFTFQQIAFLLDHYKKNEKIPRLDDYCLFVTFFPQLIAGPIVHHSQMMPQFESGLKERGMFSDIAVGVTIFGIGLFKKVMIADEMAEHASPVFSLALEGHSPTFLESWIAALSYTFQLYFDFSGYSDMAIGIARMFGILLPLNFNSPYKSQSIIDFWRRWHMTLSVFLRDYIYIPLGGSRFGTLARHRNLMLTMLIGGLWHGAGWTFVAWGGLHGVFLVINHVWSSSSWANALNRGKEHLGWRFQLSRLYVVLSWLITFVAVVIAWVLFRSESWPAAYAMLSSMLGLNGISLESTVSRWHAVVWLPSLILFVVYLPNTQEIMRRFEPAFDTKALSLPDHSRWIQWQPSAVSAVVVGLLFLLSVLNLNRVSEFVYYQF